MTCESPGSRMSCRTALALSRRRLLWAIDDLHARLRIDGELREQAAHEHEEALEVMQPGMRSQ